MTPANYFHLSKSAIGRAQGRSAVAAAAYRTATCIENVREGTVADYRRKQGVVASWTIAPPGSPEWAFDTAQLWNAAEAKDTRKNSQLAHEVTLALPASLDDAGRQSIMEKFAEELQERYGCAVTVAIHEPSSAPGADDRNWHAHMMLTTRRINGNGWGDKIRELNSLPQVSQEVAYIRERAATLINEQLAADGVDETVSHLSFKARGITDQEPTTHLGPSATALERAGVGSDRGDLNRAIAQQNRAAIESRIAWQDAEVTPEIARDLAARFGDGQSAPDGAEFTARHAGGEPPYVRGDEAEFAAYRHGGAAVEPKRDAGTPPDDSETFTGWRRFADRVRSYVDDAASQFGQFLRDESSGTPALEEGGVWTRLVGEGRKAVLGWMHRDGKAVREAAEDAANILQQDIMRRVFDAPVTDRRDLRHPPDGPDGDEPRHGGIPVAPPGPDVAPQETLSSPPGGEKALDPFGEVWEWLGSGWPDTEERELEVEPAPEPDAPEPDGPDMEP